MQYHKFSTEKFFHGSERVAVFLTEDSPQLYPQPYSTLNQREFWKITIIQSGHGFLVINGHRYPVFPGFACLIHPLDLTTWELTESLTLYNVLFHYSLVENEICQWMKKNDFFSIFRSGKNSELSIKHELLHLLDASRNITALVRKMHQEYNRDDLHTEDLLRIYLLELLLELSRASLKGFSQNRKMIVLHSLREKLQMPGAVMPDIENICSECGFSRGYLLAAYKKTFQETMGETLLKSRLEYAATLLQSSDLYVSEICRRCGFTDLSNFYRVFRRETGRSPGSFRRRENSLKNPGSGRSS